MTPGPTNATITARWCHQIACIALSVCPIDVTETLTRTLGILNQISLPCQPCRQIEPCPDSPLATAAQRGPGYDLWRTLMCYCWQCLTELLYALFTAHCTRSSSEGSLVLPMSCSWTETTLHHTVSTYTCGSRSDNPINRKILFFINVTLKTSETDHNEWRLMILQGIAPYPHTSDPYYCLKITDVASTQRNLPLHCSRLACG